MNTQDRILDAAVRLFSAQGFSGTSTREIARLADVNESSLFRHFPRKQDLFWAAVQSRLGRLRVGKELQTALESDGEPSAVLPLVISFLVQTAMYEPELVQLFYISILELRPNAERIYQQQLAPVFHSTVGYVQRCMQRGALRKMDPQIAVVALTTSIFGHQGLSRLWMNTSTPFINASEAVAAYTKFWLTALDPSASSLERPVGLDLLPEVRRKLDLKNDF